MWALATWPAGMVRVPPARVRNAAFGVVFGVAPLADAHGSGAPGGYLGDLFENSPLTLAPLHAF